MISVYNLFVLFNLVYLSYQSRTTFSLNGSSFLKSGSEILTECIDSAGNNLYIEFKITLL